VPTACPVHLIILDSVIPIIKGQDQISLCSSLSILLPTRALVIKKADRFGCEVWIMDIAVSGVRFLL
jgi:hypothetical protein